MVYSVYNQLRCFPELSVLPLEISEPIIISAGRVNQILNDAMSECGMQPSSSQRAI